MGGKRRLKPRAEISAEDAWFASQAATFKRHFCLLLPDEAAFDLVDEIASHPDLQQFRSLVVHRPEALTGLLCEIIAAKRISERATEFRLGEQDLRRQYEELVRCAEVLARHFGSLQLIETEQTVESAREQNTRIRSLVGSLEFAKSYLSEQLTKTMPAVFDKYPRTRKVADAPRVMFMVAVSKAFENYLGVPCHPIVAALTRVLLGEDVGEDQVRKARGRHHG